MPRIIKGQLIQHHVKYKEIHGVDEVVWMTVSEHRKLHERLRREGKCNIPPNQLSKISYKAAHRSNTNIRQKKNQLRFTETIGLNVVLVESIWQNPISGKISVGVWFQCKSCLPEINE